MEQAKKANLWTTLKEDKLVQQLFTEACYGKTLEERELRYEQMLAQCAALAGEYYYDKFEARPQC